MTETNTFPQLLNIWQHNRHAVEQVIQCVGDGRYCALLGPRFSGKTELLNVVREVLAQDTTWVCVYINLEELEASTQTRFFAGLIQVTAQRVSQLTGCQLLVPAMETANSVTFRNFLKDGANRLKRDLVLMIDHLEAVSNDLVQLMLTSLRAAYMEQQPDEYRLVAVVSGALSLATLTVGESSPFRGIAQRVFIGDLTDRESEALIREYITVDEVKVSPGAWTWLLQASRGDPHLIVRICQSCLQIAAQSPSRRLIAPTVRRVMVEFIRHEALSYDPLREAIRLIEDSPNLLRCILLLLERNTVPTRELPLPLSPDLDPLYLTGMVRKVPQDRYQLRNDIYRQVLAEYFHPGRVGHLLTLAGQWDLAIDYLEASIQAGNEQYRSDLLAATINSMYASEEIERAATYLMRGLSAVFGLSKVCVWHVSSDGNIRREVGQLGLSLADNQAISSGEDQLEARVYREARPLRGQEGDKYVKRAMPLLIPQRKPVGIVTIFDRLDRQEPAGQHERDLQIMGYLNQAARAFQAVNERQYQRQQEQERRELAETLREISTVISGTLDLEQVLELILEQMARVLPFDTASIQLLTPNCNALQIIAAKGFEDPSSVETRTFPLEDIYPNVQVWRCQEPLRYPDVRGVFPQFTGPKYQTTRIRGWLGAPLLVRDEAIGVITLDSFTPDLYQLEHEQLAMTFAGQAAIAIQNARLLEAERRQREITETLRQVAILINATLDLDTVLTRILEQLALVVEYDSTSLMLVEDDKLRVRAIRGFAAPDQVLPLVLDIADNPLFQKMLVSRRPIVIPDVRTEDSYRHWTGTARVRSWIGVPLVVRDRVIGQLAVDNYQADFYDEDDAELAFTFAQQAAVAIENARLYEQMGERARAQEGLLEGSRTLTERISERHRVMLDKIAEIACKIMKAPCAVVYLYRADTHAYDTENVGRYGLKKPDLFLPKDRPRQHGVSLTANIIQHGRRVVSNVSTDPDKGLKRARFIQREAILAFIGVPMKVGPKPVGVLFVNYRTPHTFSEDEKKIIEILANHAAVAILNARLYQQTNEALQKRVKELETIQEIEEAITSTLDLQEILEMILERTLRLTGATYGYIQLVSEDEQELILAAVRGATSVSLDDRSNLGEGVTGLAAQQGRTYRIPDVLSTKWAHLYRPYMLGMRSELAVPMSFEEQVVGVINIESTEVNAFSQDDERLLEGLANQAAIAIRNAQRYEELEKTKDYLLASQVVAWLGLFGADWQHTINQKTFSIGNYANGLRRWLTRQAVLPDITNEIFQGLERIEKVAESIRSVQFTSQVPPQMPGETKAQTKIDDELPGIVDRWAGGREDVDKILDLNCPGTRVEIAPQWLKVAMEKLINNALKAMPTGGRLTVTTRLKGHMVHLTLLDTGQGVPDSVRAYFLKQVVPQGKEGVGTGMGALIARFVALNHGGELSLIKSRPDEGTELLMTLPVAVDKNEAPANGGGK